MPSNQLKRIFFQLRGPLLINRFAYVDPLFLEIEKKKSEEEERKEGRKADRLIDR